MTDSDSDWPPYIDFDDSVEEFLCETMGGDLTDQLPDVVVEELLGVKLGAPRTCSVAPPLYLHTVGAREYCPNCETPRLEGDDACPWCEEPWPIDWAPCTVISGCDPHKSVGVWVWITEPAGGCLDLAAWMYHPDVIAANPNRCGVIATWKPCSSKTSECSGEPRRSDPAGHLFDDEWTTHRVCGWKPLSFSPNRCGES